MRGDRSLLRAQELLLPGGRKCTDGSQQSLWFEALFQTPAGGKAPEFGVTVFCSGFLFVATRKLVLLKGNPTLVPPGPNCPGAQLGSLSLSQGAAAASVPSQVLCHLAARNTRIKAHQEHALIKTTVFHCMNEL